MINKIKLILIVFLFLNFSNLLFAENSFFKEGKKKYNEKNMKSLSFYFNEV